jgi:hypothetical protein
MITIDVFFFQSVVYLLKWKIMELLGTRVASANALISLFVRSHDSKIFIDNKKQVVPVTYILNNHGDFF